MIDDRLRGKLMEIQLAMKVCKSRFRLVLVAYQLTHHTEDKSLDTNNQTYELHKNLMQKSQCKEDNYNLGSYSIYLLYFFHPIKNLP